MKLLPVQLPPAMDRLPLALPFSPDLLWRYPLGFPQQQPPASPLLDFKTHLPSSLGFGTYFAQLWLHLQGNGDIASTYYMEKSASDPRVWTRDDVVSFLRWCEREFDLPTFDMEMFQMNGKALCLLTKSDLAERAPSAGDVVHNVLQLLMRDFQIRLPSSPVTPTTRSIAYPTTTLPTNQNWTLLPGDFHLSHFMNQTNSVTLSPAPSVDSQSGSPQHHDSAYMNMFSSGNSGRSGSQSDSEDSFPDAGSPQRSPGPPSTPAPPPPVPAQHAPPPLSPGTKENFRGGNPVTREFFPTESPEPNTNGRLLWDFLQQLLNDPSQRYTNYIAWKNRETGVFKIVDPAGLAKLWGIQKNHLSMNYDKMSRALRYYYRVNILRKVQGERHCYQFLRNPSELKNIKNISLLRQQVNNCSRPPVKLETPESLSPEGNNENPTDLSMVSSDSNMPTDLSVVNSEHPNNIRTDMKTEANVPTNLSMISPDSNNFPTDLSRMCGDPNKLVNLTRDSERHTNHSHVMNGMIKSENCRDDD